MRSVLGMDGGRLRGAVAHLWRRGRRYARVPQPVSEEDPNASDRLLSRLRGTGRNRLTVFFRWIVLIPWAIVAFFYGIAAYVAVIIAWFALLFTGKYPEGLYDFNAGFLRFAARVNGFGYLLTDEWPPFGGDEDPNYPMRLLDRAGEGGVQPHEGPLPDLPADPGDDPHAT